MNKLKSSLFIILCVLVMAKPSLANETISAKIHNDLPPFQFQFATTPNPNNPDYVAITHIKVSRGEETKLYQTLTAPKREMAWYPFSKNDFEDIKAGFSVVDFNFDGYKDIAVLSILTAKTEWFTYWLWNPATKKFVYHEGLSNIPNLSLDPKEKRITSHVSDGHAGLLYTNGTYQFFGNTVKLVTEVQQSGKEKNGEYIYIKTTKKLQGNKLQVVESKTFTKKQAIQDIEEGVVLK